MGGLSPMGEWLQETDCGFLIPSRQHPSLPGGQRSAVAGESGGPRSFGDQPEARSERRAVPLSPLRLAAINGKD